MDFDAFAVVLLALPFPAALLAPLIARETGRAAGWILAIVPAGLFVALTTLIDPVASGHPVTLSFTWVPAIDLDANFRIDGLALVFALLITGIGAAIMAYAGEYLRDHEHRGRLLALLLLFMGSMLGLVLTDSLVALFAFWELTAISSFLLIGFDHQRMEARRAAIQALVINAIGGLALMAGGVLLHVISGTWDISQLDTPSLRHAGAAYPWVVSFITLAAFTKSAQWPFHFWLPGAMEAPTPVSAYLHSATMVQAGIYLLARMSPLLSGTPLWQGLLGAAGGVTLLWGAVLALRQTDIKRLLAQTTVAALGLLVMLLGVGGASMALAVSAFLVAHALYKAALFLVVGMLEKSTGTRDVRVLRGLRDDMPIAFISSGLAAFSMIGLPPFLGWFAKEEMFAMSPSQAWPALAFGALIVGNALMGAVALTLTIRPFLGAIEPGSKAVGDGALALWIGPAVFGLAGMSVAFGLSFVGDRILLPMASSIFWQGALAHANFGLDLLGLPFWSSILVWLLAGLIYLRLDAIRRALVAISRHGWSFDNGFDIVLRGLVRAAGVSVRTFQHGRLELYLVVLFAAFALAIALPMWLLRQWPAVPSLAGLQPHEWGVVLLAAVGIGYVVFARSRLLAIVALGIQGLALALIFVFLGAPDLGLTQLVVEILSVVVITLVMTRLHLSPRDPRPLEDWLRDGALAVFCGAGLVTLLVSVLQQPFDGRLGDFFARTSAELAHGRNIVNVILVDFRGLDTLGEISVVMGAAVAAFALLLRPKSRPEPSPPAPGEKEAV